MCKYCDCSKVTPEGAIGERVGGHSKPFFIIKYNDDNADFLDGRYWLVEGRLSFFTNYQGQTDYSSEFKRQVSINYCPVCGRKLDTYIY